MNQLQQEIRRRRTFAIISHPDAGKTTLTEKLLVLGGAIRTAGAVKSRKAEKFATSDWMELEKKRGISVTSSVMQFEYAGYKINILDTPGHQDFSEDTYRTLMAVDSVVMIIDAAKGVEPQTIKLFKVCRDRGIPIFTFINKLDRQGKEPLELFEEIEDVLGIETYPINYPIGMGQSFRGVYDRLEHRIEWYNDKRERQVQQLGEVEELGTILKENVDDYTLSQLEENLLLLDEAGSTYDFEKVRSGKQTPVFFGSAISSFGIPTFLEHYLKMAPYPQPRQSSGGLVNPDDKQFSGFVFKIQANMNPSHRDRIAFLRICSGRFEKGMTVYLDRTGKQLKLAQPQQFFADSRELIDEAFPGDIVGLYDTGFYQIGDTVCEAKETFNFGALPQFAPEHFAKVRAKNAMKQKHFLKGVSQLAQEGAIQVYKTPFEETVLGVVGTLQFDVFVYRMQAEYGVDLDIEHMPHQVAKWIAKREDAEDLRRHSNNLIVTDYKDRPVIIFENDFSLRWFQQKHPDIELRDSSHNM
ncbi:MULTISPECIES: peptide chain release factor 3 [unclassified Sporolactobacillus]|uniref:peptide chain release factor 3 n=1 Tax=unclassified Sporolactobacillus TaxID=2628533 RepID=UPI002367F344|nr:peptide chain release factor 3 [Sporolactobacillus sp. CQH2019]MDD9149395.1 peptide chain release factor 3 [Sporolactobacillus sp. CQH2019]